VPAAGTGYHVSPVTDKGGRPAVGRLLDATGVADLRIAVKRLREGGMSETQAATEVVRENFYEWIDSGEEPRLRIVK
jgi:hypothetical protein